MSNKLNRRKFIGALAALPHLPIIARANTADDNNSGHPNILFIMTDQLRYDCIGTNGNNLISDLKYKSICEELKERILYWLITASETDQIAPKWLV